MILVDTSIWVDHFRSGLPALHALLERQLVLCHPMVVGELACGGLSRRGRILGDLEELPTARIATHREVLRLIEGRKLMGRGIGYVDAHLLAAALLSPPARLWTGDRRLAGEAARLGVGYTARAPDSA